MNISVVGFKSLEIQEIIEMSYLEMIETCSLSPGKPLKFCNGYLLDISGFDPSDEIKNEEANGNYKFQIVYFANAPTGIGYHSTLKHKDSNTDIAVFDLSKSSFYSELTKYCVDYMNKQVDNNKE